MKFLLSCSAIALSLGLAGAVGAQETDSILDPTPPSQLIDQDVNPNQELLDILRRAAMQGPKFVIDPRQITLEVLVGSTGTQIVRINNAGDETGEIAGINAIGSIPGLSLDASDCSDEIAPGDFCEITVGYEAEVARSIETALVGTMNERERKSFEIPLSVAAIQPSEPVRQPAPQPVAEPVKKGPNYQGIARGYFGSMGGMQPAGGGTPRGFVIVRRAEPPSDAVAGVSYGNMRVEQITTQDRYDPEIPSTRAGLPVDRDRILTTDRVIKAVLETPIGNVMCGKAVALVESDVYSATGSRPLIPAGSRVVGRCGDFVDERVGIAWQRIITTDGRSITFAETDADTRDAGGLGGAVGRVYSSPFDKYALPIVSTMIDSAAGALMAILGEDEDVVTDANGNVSQSRSATNEGLRIVTDDARSTAQRLIEDIRDTREIAVIPAGSRIDIEINEDVYFDDHRRVVRLQDAMYEIPEIQDGVASRELPENLILEPAEPGYDGPTITVGARRYMVSGEAAPGVSSEPASLQTLRDIQTTPEAQVEQPGAQ